MFSTTKREQWYILDKVVVWTEGDKLCERQNAQDNWGDDLFEPLQCGDYSLMRRVSNKRKGAGGFIEAEADKQRTHPRILQGSWGKMEVSLTL